MFTTPVTTSCTVVEGGTTRRFRITIEPPTAPACLARPGRASRRSAPPATGGHGGSRGATPVFSPFEGKTELVEICVRAGDVVVAGQVVAAVEAMKAKHDVRAPHAGTVVSIDAELGTAVMAGKPILTIGG